MKKLFLFLSLFLMLLVMSSCAESTKPLSPLSESITDERLIGNWYACEPKATKIEDCAFIYIGKTLNEKYLSAVLIIYDGETVHSLTSDLNITRIGEGYYVSCLYPKEVGNKKKDKEDIYLIFKYEFQSPGRFSLDVMSNSGAVFADIVEGRLKGEIGNWEVLITDTPEKLRDLISTADHKTLFEPFLVFTSVPPPVLPIANQPVSEKKME